MTDDSHRIGLHRLQLQGDVLFIQPHGDVSLAEAEALSALLSSYFDRMPHSFLLADARELKPPAAPIRRLFASWLQNRQPRPRIVIFGANLLIRAASRLVIAAARQLYRLDLDFIHCDTEAAARARIEQLRLA